MLFLLLVPYHMAGRFFSLLRMFTLITHWNGIFLSVFDGHQWSWSSAGEYPSTIPPPDLFLAPVPAPAREYCCSVLALAGRCCCLALLAHTHSGSHWWVLQPSPDWPTPRLGFHVYWWVLRSSLACPHPFWLSWMPVGRTGYCLVNPLTHKHAWGCYIFAQKGVSPTSVSCTHWWDLLPSRGVPRVPLSGLFLALCYVCTDRCFNPVWHGTPSVSTLVGECCNLAQLGTAHSLSLGSHVCQRVLRPIPARPVSPSFCNLPAGRSWCCSVQARFHIWAGWVPFCLTQTCPPANPLWTILSQLLCCLRMQWWGSWKTPNSSPHPPSDMPSAAPTLVCPQISFPGRSPVPQPGGWDGIPGLVVSSFSTYPHTQKKTVMMTHCHS